MTAGELPAHPASSAQEIAGRFVAARRNRQGFALYPGEPPRSMAEAYAVQDAAISRWGDRVAGWKVGMVPPQQQAQLGVNRLAGPIFAANVWRADDVVTLPVIPSGFAAVEAEFVARIGADADPDKRQWTLEEAIAQIDAVFIGLEFAGSPLADINGFGSAVVASDFGNNGGLVLGHEISDWRVRLNDISVLTQIDGQEVGRGSATSIPLGALESVRFLLEHCAARGRPLTAGTLISTGATTGVHEISPGQRAMAVFSGVGEIACRA